LLTKVIVEAETPTSASLNFELAIPRTMLLNHAPPTRIPLVFGDDVLQHSSCEGNRERRGCLTKFLRAPPPAGSFPQHWGFSHNMFLAYAMAGLQQDYNGWTAFVDDERVSFQHGGT
jgi:hypothetical protein